MKSIAKVLHMIGMAMFLGSIAVYIAISTTTNPTQLADYASARRCIAADTHAVTMPGLWLAVLSGVALAWRYKPLPGWIKLKLSLALLVVLNCYLLVMPAVDQAALLAVQAAKNGQRDPAVAQAVQRETVFGAGNVLLVLGMLGLAVRRPGRPVAR